jgi:V/A-type H+/Na+-transporting ATPase subunit E
MALEKLLASLETEAAAEAARLEAETEQEARRIVEEARTQARALAEEAAQADEAELRREAEQRRADARLEAAAVLREAREDAFQEFLAELRAQLADLRARPSYPAILRALVRETLAALPTATTLRVDPRDEALARELLDELATKADVGATLASAGGVELAGGDGRTARNTIEERLENAEPALRLLFGEQLARRPDPEREPETQPSSGP